jgi:hypothetical protein
VALELLDHLLGLHVPDVDAPVLGAAHDPALAARDGEGGEDAELVVDVAGVGLEALARGVVPEAQLAVEGAREDVLGVWGEGDEGAAGGRAASERGARRWGRGGSARRAHSHWRVVVVDQALQALPCDAFVTTEPLARKDAS